MKNTARVVLLLTMLAARPGIVCAQEDRGLVHEGLVHAPLAQVWAAFATKEGLESWMVAHAEIELRVGGLMKTQYDPKGATDDAKAIVNTILSYEPMRMLSFRVAKAPQGFPFPNAIAHMWTVIYFEAQGESATWVREICMGFSDDPESRKMREFFNRGNATTMTRLQRRFATGDPAQGEEFLIRARVQDVVALSTFRGTVTTVGVDPRFAATVSIESARPVLADFPAGATVTFALHSPTRLFGAADAKGHAYNFLLRRETAAGTTNYSSLEILR